MSISAEASPAVNWREQIWFARICMVFGATELVTFLVNFATVLKVQSGMPIVAQGTYQTYVVAYPYMGSSLFTGILEVGGGTLLGCLAYARILPRHLLFRDVELPSTTEILALAFRGWGVCQFNIAVMYVALAIYHREFGAVTAENLKVPPGNVDLASAFERGLLALVLIWGGGALANLILRRRRPTNPGSTPNSY